MQLLGAHADYDGEASTVVPMDTSLLAVPATSGLPQDVLCADSGSYSVQCFCDQHLLPHATTQQARGASDFVKPYLDHFVQITAPVRVRLTPPGSGGNDIPAK